MKEKVSYLQCRLVSCDERLTGKRKKYCSLVCQKKANTYKNQEVYKSVYGASGTDGGPRSMVGASSIKKEESFVGGQDRWCSDDYHVPKDVFAIAEANHETYVLDRNDHENQVVMDGLQEFVKVYNQCHDVNYATVNTRKWKLRRESEDSNSMDDMYFFATKDKLHQAIHRQSDKGETHAKGKESMAPDENQSTANTSSKS